MCHEHGCLREEAHGLQSYKDKAEQELKRLGVSTEALTSLKVINEDHIGKIESSLAE